MPARRSRTPGDYDVGYAKPPVATQFKPGQSGNPRGRPKKIAPEKFTIAPGLSPLHMAVMQSCLTPLDDPGGGWYPSTNLERIVDGLVERAAAGDPRPARLVLELLAEAKQADQARSRADDEYLSMRFTLFIAREIREGRYNPTTRKFGNNPAQPSDGRCSNPGDGPV